MCGIIGIVDKKGPVDPAVLAILRNSMGSRGPDGVGDFLEHDIGMSMCRLAVIDTAHGQQPMTSLDRTIVAFQNGEIYNYRSLKQELEQTGFVFRSNSDTEVLAHGYARWGIEGLLDRIDGMYAIAIFDKRTNELHLARDRFGEKPLFYCHGLGRFAYASSLLPLVALPWVDGSIDLVGLDRYLALHFVAGNRTIFKGVRRVLPGERLCLSIDRMSAVTSRYYQLPLGQEQPLQEGELKARLERAVTSRLLADVPVGIFLSGGLDSSLVAAIAARHSPGIATFSMGFSSSDYDERRHAEQVAKHIGSHHRSFLFDENDFSTLLSQVVEVLDEPLGDQAMLPVYWLSREARRYVTVVLSGEGADELFGGYSYYRNFLPKNGDGAALSSLPRRLIDDSTSMTPSGFPLLTTAKERSDMMQQAMAVFDAWERDFVRSLNRAFCGAQRAGAADLCSWLPDDLLVKLDRMTMAHSLEGRAPYLQREVVEAALRLPASERICAATSKVALRRIAKDWLPDDIINRPKQGFVLPMGQWLQNWLNNQGGAAAYFCGNEFPGLDTKHVAKYVRNQCDERLVFALIAIIEWWKSFKRRSAELRHCTGEGTALATSLRSSENYRVLRAFSGAVTRLHNSNGVGYAATKNTVGGIEM